jgi:Protein of unknown function (DUF2442)
MTFSIRKARVCGHHALRSTFNDGTTKQVNVRPLLDGAVFEPLRDPAYFATMTTEPKELVDPVATDLREPSLHSAVEPWTPGR